MSTAPAEFRFCPQCGAPLATGRSGGRAPLLCQTPHCGFVHWDSPVPVVAALIECVDRGGMVLLARNCAWPEKMFGLVSGFIERGESPEQAAAREVREETNLDAECACLIGVYAYPREHQLIVAYHVRARGEIELNRELAEYRLIVPARLKAWDLGTGPAVRDWLAQRASAVNG